MTSAKERILHDALIDGALNASILNLELTGDLDSPLRPESLVQIEVARSLREHGWTRIELEADTDSLIQKIRWSPVTKPELHKIGKRYPNYPVGRPGAVDLACYENGMPSVLIEVKDEIVDTNNDIASDVARLDKFLHMQNRLSKRMHVHTCGLLFFIGKSAQKYKVERLTADKLAPFSRRSITTAINNLATAISSETVMTYRLRGVVGSAAKSMADVVRDDEFGSFSGQERICDAVSVVLSRR